MNCHKINGVNIYAPPTRAALIDYALAHNSILVAVNAEKILHATDTTRDIINRNVGFPDGLGAIMALKKYGYTDVAKIPGCELWLDIIAQHYLNKRFYFVGGTEAVINQTISKLQQDFVGIHIVGFRNGYLGNDSQTSAEQQNALLDDIAAQKPDVVFVAMGSPKQELLMEQMSRKHPALYQGLGGSFDVYTGNVQRAPQWWLRHNVEWLYRLLQEPSRIKRQIHLVRFLFMLKFNRF